MKDNAPSLHCRLIIHICAAIFYISLFLIIRYTVGRYDQNKRLTILIIMAVISLLIIYYIVTQTDTDTPIF